MLLWVEGFMWGLSRVLATIFQTVGVLGLLVSGFIGLIKLSERILDFAEEGDFDESSGD